MTLSPETVRSAIAGNPDAFAAVHAHYNPKLRRYLSCFVRHNSDKLDDLMQSTWLQVYRKLRQFRGDADLGTWIYRVGVNQALMTQRKPDERMAPSMTSLDKPLPSAIDGAADIYPELRVSDSGFEWVNGSSEREQLYKAIEKLPAYSRTVFHLRLDGLMFSEIAKAMGVSVGTVKSYHFRGIKMLAKRMGAAQCS